MPDETDTQTKPKRAAKTDKSVEGAGKVQHGPADEPSAVIEAEPGAVDAAVANLGEAVREAEGPTGGYDLSEAGHQTAIETAERAASEWELDPASLIADARDFMLDQIKRRPKPWSVLRADEQRDVAANCEHAAQELVRKIVEAIAAKGQPDPVRVMLQKVTLGDEIQITGKVKPMGEAEEDKAVQLLHHARGKFVMLTVASKDDYAGGQREPEIAPDEPALPFEAGADEITDDDLAGLAENERVNLKTGMVERRDPGGSDVWDDIRPATPTELANERERTADFDDGQPGGEPEAAQA